MVRESATRRQSPEPAAAQDGASQQGEQREEHTFGGGPPARLWLPSDWFNFLADGPDADAARRRYEGLMQKVFPNMPREGHREIAQGLMRWRERLWSQGFLVHGVICVPEEDDHSKAKAFWQVVVATMKLPRTNPELNPVALLERVIGQSELSYATHVETFETELGLGMGVIGRPPLRLPDNAATRGDRELPKYGMAAAVSCAPGAEYGLSVVGVSLDPEQDRQLAMLVALIAGKSTLVTEEHQERSRGEQGPTAAHAASRVSARPATTVHP
jgi:hypothetical protein